MLSAPEGAAWRGFHLVYHGDRDRLLREAVAPTAAALLAEGEAERFFFLRYDLGGPHVRFRLLPAPGRAEAVAGRVREAAAAFFARAPSTPLPEETVRRANRGIMASDPSEAAAEDAVFPDCTLREEPVAFEVERYGGPALAAHSVELFALSSVDALRFFAESPEVTAAGRLGEAARAIVRYAGAFARDEREFHALLAFAVPREGPMARLAERGDEAFDARPEPLRALLREELARPGPSAPEGEDEPRWMRGPRRLAWEIREADEARRWRIVSSQIHLSLNRLGVRMTDEVYLGRMLWRAARELPGAWEPAPPPAGGPGAPLPDRVRAALARFARRAVPA